VEELGIGLILNFVRKLALMLVIKQIDIVVAKSEPGLQVRAYLSKLLVNHSLISLYVGMEGFLVVQVI